MTTQDSMVLHSVFTYVHFCDFINKTVWMKVRFA